MITNIWIGIAVFALIITLFRINFNNNDTHSKKKESGFLTVYIQSIFPLILAFVLVILIDSHKYDYALIESYQKQEIITPLRIKENRGYYVFYSIENNELKRFIAPKYKSKIEKIRIKSGDIRIETDLLYSRKGKVVENEKNSIRLYLPEGYETEWGGDKIYSINDLKTKNIVKNECVKEMKYNSLNKTYTFYIKKNYITEFNITEDKNVKIKFKIGDTKGYKACLNFNYYETLNGEKIKMINEKSIYEVIVPKDFNLLELKN